MSAQRRIDPRHVQPSSDHKRGSQQQGRAAAGPAPESQRSLLETATWTLDPPLDPPPERSGDEAASDSEQVLLERILTDARRDPASYLLRSDVGQHGE